MRRLFSRRLELCQYRRNVSAAFRSVLISMVDNIRTGRTVPIAHLSLGNMAMLARLAREVPLQAACDGLLACDDSGHVAGSIRRPGIPDKALRSLFYRSNV